MANVIVAVACNLIAAFILISGIFSSIRDGWKITLTKLILVVGSGVGIYFLIPVIGNKLYKVKEVTTFLNETGGGISTQTVNSCMFLILFVAFYAVILAICSIIRHCMIKKLRDKKLNKLKLKRARSINPRAEKMVARAEWKALKAKYREKRRWYHSLINGFIGAIIAIVVGFVVLMPYGYIAKDINYKGNKEYLVKGFNYTLNGVIPDKVSDFLVHAKEEAPVVEEPTVDKEVPEVGPEAPEVEVPVE